MGDKLRLRADDCEDLAVLAACLQDARIALREMCYMPEEKRFVAAFTRYRRERQSDPSNCEGLTECQSALVLEGIEAVKHKGVATRAEGNELVLLTIATEPGTDKLIHIDLVFEGDACIQLRTDAISARLDDFGDVVDCKVTPCDHFAADFWAQAPQSAPA